jgi:hypothetical protein
LENRSIPHTWSNTQKIGFRFVFILFSLFILVNNNGAFPFWDVIFAYPTELLHTLIPWIGKHVLSLSYDITVFTNGSGDTTYDYLVVLTFAVFAALGTIIWSVLDSKRINYITLYYWLTMAVRFYVGLMLIQYGLVKVLKLQFPSPSLARLTQTYGDSSPMGLAWTFLGFSKGYNYFMGIAEIAAIFLLFRRTMTFGAIISLMTTLNVMAVNYFYDIPVKIVSTTLVVMTLFLLMNNISDLWRFFFTGSTVTLQVINAPIIKAKWLRISKFVFKALLLGYIFIFGIFDLWALSKEYGDGAPKPKFYGLYNVDVFIRNNDTMPALLTDSVRWKHLIIEQADYAQLRTMTSKKTWLSFKADTILHKLVFTEEKDSTKHHVFRYKDIKPNTFELRGLMEGDSLSIFMTRKNTDEFPLTNRGFHWISEYPFNR